jgi:hypothetical protein
MLILGPWRLTLELCMLIWSLEKKMLTLEPFMFTLGLWRLILDLCRFIF